MSIPRASLTKTLSFRFAKIQTTRKKRTRTTSRVFWNPCTIRIPRVSFKVLDCTVPVARGGLNTFEVQVQSPLCGHVLRMLVLFSLCPDSEDAGSEKIKPWLKPWT